MNSFNLYAKYYDLFYHDKNYEEEVNYVDELIKKNSLIEATHILDMGCGTGIHANLLSQLNYKVDGVDVSEKMIATARSNYSDNKKLRFFNGDITNFRSKNKYQVVTSLFHVISYQNSNDDLLSSFKTAFDHLEDSGLFIFDFWYGPGVLTDLPEIRTKTLATNEIKVKRKATPTIHFNLNVVTVNYDISISNGKSGKLEKIVEKHSMRYLFKPELEFYLEQTGFKLVSIYNWLTMDSPDSESWTAVVVAIKLDK